MSGWLVRILPFHVPRFPQKSDIFQNIYYRRTRRQDINLVTDIRLYPEDKNPDSLENWHKVDTSVRAGIYGIAPLFLWYKTGKTTGEMTSEEKLNIITEVDVLYGEDIPWYGFEKIEPPTLEQTTKVEATWITIRRGVKSEFSICACPQSGI